VVRVKGDDEAIRVANASEYGLAGAVFSRDGARGLSVARQIDAGHVHVNGATVQNEPQAPWRHEKQRIWSLRRSRSDR
jgi:acyl-CoA reductase-like NAD-dependent aldehyde dehydrogenase